MRLRVRKRKTTRAVVRAARVCATIKDPSTLGFETLGEVESLYIDHPSGTSRLS